MPPRYGRKASPAYTHTQGMFSGYTPSQLDAPTLWEAFASGEFGDWAGGAIETGQEDYLARTEKLYDVVVGPSFGYTAEGEADKTGLLGQDWNQYIATPDFTTLERAEREFRLEIGDPYQPGVDPFRWEQLSRYTPAAAQGLLQRQLYGKGERLGGFAGGEYEEEMGVAEETYTTGLTGKREELTYGTLTAGVGMEAGTTGAALRTGAGVEQAEDVLEEAYRDVRDLEAGYKETRVGTETGLEKSLNEALDKYITTLSEEKQDWYDDILRDVRMIQDVGEAEFAAGGRDAFDLERGGEEFGWTQGLFGFGERGLTPVDDPKYAEACGIGMLRNEEGVCVPVEDLEEGEFGELVSTAPTVVCGDGSLAYSEGQCPEPTIQCWNDEMVYDQAACPEEPSVQCWNGDMVYDEAACPDPPLDSSDIDLDLDIDVTSGLLDLDDATVTEVELDVYGCTNPAAPNYNPDATADDGSCEEEILEEFMCWDGSFVASEADCPEEPVFEQATFETTTEQYMCPDGSLVASKEDCPWDEYEEPLDQEEIPGCTDPNAMNYNSAATVDDNSCSFGDSAPCEDFGEDYEMNALTGECEWMGETGAQFGSTHCINTGCNPGRVCTASGTCVKEKMLSDTGTGFGVKFQQWWEKIQDKYSGGKAGQEDIPSGPPGGHAMHRQANVSVDEDLPWWMKG